MVSFIPKPSAPFLPFLLLHRALDHTDRKTHFFTPLLAQGPSPTGTPNLRAGSAESCSVLGNEPSPNWSLTGAIEQAANSPNKTFPLGQCWIQAPSALSSLLGFGVFPAVGPAATLPDQPKHSLHLCSEHCPQPHCSQAFIYPALLPTLLRLARITTHSHKSNPSKLSTTPGSEELFRQAKICRT